MEQLNEFKVSALRQFGSEQISFTATVHSPNMVLSQDEIKSQVAQIGSAIEEAFKAVQEREISEKELLVAASQRRTAAIKAHDEALKEEMSAAKGGKKTMEDARKLSDQIMKEGSKK